MSGYTMSWMEALKVWNTGKTWCVPRKGTSDYDEVMEIRKGGKRKTVEEVVKEVETEVKKRKMKPKKEKVTMKITMEEKPKMNMMERAIEKLRKVEQETKERNTKKRMESAIRKLKEFETKIHEHNRRMKAEGMKFDLGMYEEHKGKVKTEVEKIEKKKKK